jgi:RimJ/RimL family protein N-acetyltransferase
MKDSMTAVGTFQATLPKKDEGSFAYVIDPSYGRQGYAREMVACGLTHVFETDEQPRLYAEMDTRNLGSIRLVESLGLTRVATTLGADFFKGSSSDEYISSLTRAQWQVFDEANGKR